MRYQITAISIAYTGCGYEGITHVWSGNQWWSRKDAVTAILSGGAQFFTRDFWGNEAEVTTQLGVGGWYLRTLADCLPSNNLLAMPINSDPAA